MLQTVKSLLELFFSVLLQVVEVSSSVLKRWPRSEIPRLTGIKISEDHQWAAFFVAAVFLYFWGTFKVKEGHFSRVPLISACVNSWLDFIKIQWRAWCFSHDLHSASLSDCCAAAATCPQTYPLAFLHIWRKASAETLTHCRIPPETNVSVLSPWFLFSSIFFN